MQIDDQMGHMEKYRRYPELSWSLQLSTSRKVRCLYLKAPWGPDHLAFVWGLVDYNSSSPESRQPLALYLLQRLEWYGMK